MSTNKEIQKDEITALESIYNSEEFSYNFINGQYNCTLNVFLSLPNGYYIKYKDLKDKYGTEEKIFVDYLPPITLYIKLPTDYPSKSPPELTISCSWLIIANLKKLLKHLAKLWCDIKQEILFTWTCFLQNDLLEFLNMRDHIDLSHLFTIYKNKQDRENENENKPKNNASKDDSKDKILKRRTNSNKKWFKKIRFLSFNRNPMQALMDYDENRKLVEFKKNFYTCKICFSDRLGESCTQFKPCCHIFCKDCITKYLEVKITDGIVKNISCPEEKCPSEASPDQIKDLVTPELFEKYDSTLLSVTLNTMVDIIYCPRRHCQYPVSKEPDEKMATCPACQYTFCIYCKMVYHGIEDCKILSVEKTKIIENYKTASDKEKLDLERRYGKKQLENLLHTSLSENWIQDNSHRCPSCKTAIEKLDGCNKMTCGRCNTFFCWLCGSRISTENPYFHYQDPNSSCHMKLFLGAAVDEFDDDFDDDDVFDFNFDPNWESDDDSDYFDDDYIIEFDD